MALTGTQVPMPPLELGQTYTFTVAQMYTYVDTGTNAYPGDSQAIGWSLYVFGSTPPPGMTVTATTFSGTPTEAGDFVVVLEWANRYNQKTRYNVLVAVAGNEPEPVEVIDAKADVAALMGQPDNPDLVAVIDKALTTINAMVSAYTRGNGFTGGVPNRELRAVIRTATARLTANPEQVASTVGGVTVGAGFNGWSLAELAVLNRYRKRAL
ncbi:hypothetical protein GCM10025789_02430 [Tessaracoccus lubricantis]|uniref:Uncharacterized protein n=1 Tax=Tessaracoccus lubricantis TaxID=545543 RepID=A0ABP9EYQ3_9ACTN